MGCPLVGESLAEGGESLDRREVESGGREDPGGNGGGNGGGAESVGGADGKEWGVHNLLIGRIGRGL